MSKPQSKPTFRNFLRSRNTFNLSCYYWIMFFRENGVVLLENKWFRWVRIGCTLTTFSSPYLLKRENSNTGMCLECVQTHSLHGMECMLLHTFHSMEWNTPNMGYKGMVYKGEILAVLKILGKLRVPSTQACSAKGFP